MNIVCSHVGSSSCVFVLLVMPVHAYYVVVGCSSSLHYVSVKSMCCSRRLVVVSRRSGVLPDALRGVCMCFRVGDVVVLHIVILFCDGCSDV